MAEKDSGGSMFLGLKHVRGRYLFRVRHICGEHAFLLEHVFGEQNYSTLGGHII